MTKIHFADVVVVTIESVYHAVKELVTIQLIPHWDGIGQISKCRKYTLFIN